MPEKRVPREGEEERGEGGDGTEGRLTSTALI
jgi:hypothetical protein